MSGSRKNINNLPVATSVADSDLIEVLQGGQNKQATIAQIGGGGGGGGTVTASNGLTKTGDDIALGGLLTGDTTITTGGHNLIFSGAGGNYLFDNNGGLIDFTNTAAVMVDGVVIATSASNGLTKTDGDIALGGTQTGPVTIDSNGNDFTILSTGGAQLSLAASQNSELKTVQGLDISTLAGAIGITSPDTDINLSAAGSLNMVGGAVRFKNLVDTFYGTLSTTGLTANRSYTYPNAAGTLALIAQTITDGVTTSAPSQDAVADALALTVFTLRYAIVSATMTNQPSTEQDFWIVVNGVAVRDYVDLTGYNFARICLTLATASTSANNPRAFASYATDGGTVFSTIGAGTVASGEAVSLAAPTGPKFSSWTALPAGAKTNVVVRVSVHGGDGAADPVINSLTLQFKR